MSPESIERDAETPLYSGRAVAKLAEEAFSSGETLDALSGTIQWSAEVAVQHGLADERGRQPLSSRTLRKVTGVSCLPASWVVPWFVLRFLSPRYGKAKAAAAESSRSEL